MQSLQDVGVTVVIKQVWAVVLLGAATELGKCIVAIAGDIYVLIQVVQILQVLQVLAVIRALVDNRLTFLVQHGMLVQLAALVVANVTIRVLQVIFQAVADQADIHQHAVSEKHQAVWEPLVI